MNNNNTDQMEAISNGQTNSLNPDMSGIITTAIGIFV